MSTRADFYIGRGKNAEWIGSIAFDGYREGIDEEILKSKNEKEFRDAVSNFLSKRDDATFPNMGWPWPWNDSSVTDCSYWFFDGKVWEELDKHYFPCNELLPDWNDNKYKEIINKYDLIEFPDMSNIKNVTLGNRSGLIVFGVE